MKPRVVFLYGEWGDGLGFDKIQSNMLWSLLTQNEKQIIMPVAQVYLTTQMEYVLGLQDDMLNGNCAWIGGSHASSKGSPRWCSGN